VFIATANDTLTVQRNAIPTLTLLTDSLRKQPVQHAEVDATRPELPTVKLQIMDIRAVLETVEFDEPAFTKRNPKMLTAQVPHAFELEGIIQIEPFYFAR